MNKTYTQRFAYLFFIFLFFTQLQFTFATGIWGNVSVTYDFGLPMPLPGATITAIPLDVNYDPVYTTESNEDGIFELELDPWVYHITCSKDGFTAVNTTLELGEEVEYLEFYLSPENDTPDPAWIIGQVTAQLTPMGPVFPISGAVIIADQGDWCNVYSTETGDSGHYELEVISTCENIPFTVHCETEYGYQSAELFIEPNSENIVNFHFNAFDDAVPHPYDLHVEIQESEPPGAALYWEYDFPPDPGDVPTIFKIYANWDWSNPDWELIAETSETSHVFPIGDIVDWSTCFKVTAVMNGVESEPSNVACVNPEEPDMPPPYDLTAYYDPSMGLTGGAVLEWEYLSPDDNIPIFNVYVLLYEEWYHAGETEETNFEFYFGDFVPPPDEVCFKVTAVYEEGESESSNIACVYTGDVEGDAVIFGEVFYLWGDAVELVAGAHITAVGAVADWAYETYTNEAGFYELGIIAGEFFVTCTLENGESQTTDIMYIDPGHEERVDFWFGEEYEIHALTGMVFGNGTDEEHPLEEYPLDDATIHATCLTSGEVFVTHSIEGWYWLELPYPDEYHIIASKEGYNSADVTLYVEGIVEFVFMLESDDSGGGPEALLGIGESAGVPGGTAEVPLFLDSNSNVAGIQFTIQDLPNAATVAEFQSNYECFSASFNEIEGSVVGIYFSLEGCVLEPGEHHFGTLVYEISEDAEIFEGIELQFLEAIVASENGIPLQTEVINGFITLGLLGDINADGEQNILDIVQLVNFIIFVEDPTDYEYWAGDINTDGDLNILDVVLLVNIILEG